jgi:phytoene dehydrogenase-like protein
MEYPDVVVIGSGVGGLCAAARLTGAGCKVTVVERLPILGGRFTILEYKGYKVPTGAWALPGPDHGPIVQTLNHVGAKVEIRKFKPANKYRIGGKDIELPERGGLFAVVSSASKGMEEAQRILKILKRAMQWQEPSDEISWEQWLSEYTDNKLVHGIFNSISVGFAGMWENEIPAGEFIRCLRTITRLKYTVGLPKGGLKAIIDALAEKVREEGGSILTKTEVEEIVVDDGKVKGVVAEREGKKLEITSEVVISNAGPQQTIHLAGRENFEKGYLRQVSRRPVPPAGITILFACDKPIIDFPGLLTFVETRAIHGAVVPSLLYPDFAPAGKHLMLVYGGLRSTDVKMGIENALEECRANFPELEKHGEILMVQSYRDEWPVNRSGQGYDVAQKVPGIENLYNVGDGVKPRGHVMAEGAAESARIVSEDVIRRRQVGR